jgi:inorganic pyrophosphatase
VVVTCRPIGILKMEDEGGVEGAGRAHRQDPADLHHWKKPEDINPLRLKQIAHFFEHYKDLEPGKWVKVLGWEGVDAAKQEILDGIANYAKQA